jgi:hypothetical protein
MSIGESLADASAVLNELLENAARGIRPATPRESGLASWMLDQGSEAA